MCRPLLALLLLTSALHAADRPPNVLVFFVDDMGWNDLGVTGNPFHETPHADRLAAEGMRFTDAYAACPVCSPTRAALMTGRYPASIGLTNFIPGHYRPYAPLLEPDIPLELPADEKTFAEMLGDRYVTATFGKWHLGWEADEKPGARGFDEWVEAGGNLDPGWRTEGGGGKREGFTTELITERTERFVRDHADEPWACVVSHFAVHIPIQAREELIEKYRAKPKVPGHVCDPAYAALVEMTDASLGRLLAVLEETGQAGNTLVLFTSDNGGLHTVYHGDPVHHGQSGNPVDSNRPLRGEKGNLYEGGVRVPLLARWPGRVLAGTTCDVPVSTVDIAPTILSSAGMAPPDDVRFDGTDLTPLLTGGCDGHRTELADRPVFWHYPHYHHGPPASSVRRGDWKLIHQYTDDGVELYNLARDRGETRNLAAVRPEKAAELKGLLDEWRAEVGAKPPTANPAYQPERAGEWWTRPRPGAEESKPVEPPKKLR